MFQQRHHDVRGVGNQLQLHILGLMMYEPERWARDLGLPDYFTDREHQARYHLWKAIGTRMGIRGIWDSYGEVEPWILAFEEKHGARSSEGVEIYRGQIRGFEKYFPRPLRFLAGPVLTAGLPVSARDHLDAPRVPVLVDKAMRAVATVVRLTEPVRPVNLSSTWVRDFSRMGDDPDISRMGYQHDTSSDPPLRESRRGRRRPQVHRRRRPAAGAGLPHARRRHVTCRKHQGSRQMGLPGSEGLFRHQRQDVIDHRRSCQ
ncbi:hypothetical protein Csp1_18360 [Corynebacterium provencense]|uniref:ER-bound oxygenase mpaB/mpaB'/Rubber oxygenase catalytic domain-containing protein n=1 Tax=Corynebacterium provencense TaxID=1737425 RepID=A0A2Z3YPE9_9CORY|nr:hypothetical protein [Corynebacterium provencense]AWT26612.1 hypothetical protein Csp1_18360 [Corynebacterium provencense]